MMHVGMHRILPELTDHASYTGYPRFVSCHLCRQVGHVFIDIAARILTGGKQCASFRLPQYTAIDEFEIIDNHAFLLYVGRVRGCGTGCTPTDISVMPARCNKEQRLGTCLIKNRGDDSDIR